MTQTVTVGADGRIVIPAELRGQLGLEPGDELTVSRCGDGLRLERPRAGHSLAEVIWDADVDVQAADWLAAAG